MSSSSSSVTFNNRVTACANSYSLEDLREQTEEYSPYLLFAAALEHKLSLFQIPAYHSSSEKVDADIDGKILKFILKVRSFTNIEELQKSDTFKEIQKEYCAQYMKKTAGQSRYCKQKTPEEVKELDNELIECFEAILHGKELTWSKYKDNMSDEEVEYTPSITEVGNRIIKVLKKVFFESIGVLTTY